MRVTALHSYPVKGCYRVDHRQAQVESWGLAGDRRFMVVDCDNAMITQRQEPALTRVRPRYEGEKLVLSAKDHPDLTVIGGPGQLTDTNVHRTPIKASPVGDAADEWLSSVLERPARLLFLDDPRRRPVGRGSRPDDRVSFADAYPVLLTNTASLDVLNDFLIESHSSEWPAPMTRFRPNIVIGGAAPWAEDTLAGHVVSIGDVIMRAATICDRCLVTTIDQETGERGHEPLRALGLHRNIDQRLLFGLNMIPDRVGVIRVGDEVRDLGVCAATSAAS